MPIKVRLSDEQFAQEFEKYGAEGCASRWGITVRNVYGRRRRVEEYIGRGLVAPNGPIQVRGLSEKAMLPAEVKNGVVLIGSDAHYWDFISTAHLAFIKLCKELKPKIVVLNGDVLDFPRISRHPPIGWEGRPSVVEELNHAKLRLAEIERAAPKGSRRIWPLGNHDLRYESRLAQAAPEFEGVEGTHLKDQFKRWEPCWGVNINDQVVVKHRFRNGVHSNYNNTLHGGMTMVTGHSHALGITPFTDYRGTRWGVNSGTLAEPYGPQFIDYTEANPVNWRSGFVVLTFEDSKLQTPELVYVVGEGKYDFRGETHNV